MSLFTPFQTRSAVVDRLISTVASAFRLVESNFLPIAVVVEQAIATTDTRVHHGLGRTARGHVIVGQSADARIWDGAASNDPQKFFNLKASAVVTVRLVCF